MSVHLVSTPFMQPPSGIGDSICHSWDNTVLMIYCPRTSADNVVPEIWVCADLQNGPQKKFEAFPDLQLPICPSTPPCDPPQVMPTDEPSVFDVIPGEAIDHTAFLSEPWAFGMSTHYHFKLTFCGSYYVASMMNCTALALGKTGDNIQIVFSDNNGKKKQETVKSRYLAPAHVWWVTKGLKVAVIHGERRGQVFWVQSINKKWETSKLLSAHWGHWEEQLCKLCIVVCHEQTGCDCALWAVWINVGHHIYLTWLCKGLFPAPSLASHWWMGCQLRHWIVNKSIVLGCIYLLW